MSTTNDYYVYVYIDPRNYEEFYYGKGRGSRKEAHLSENSDTQKAQRIAKIHKEQLHPIIRVIARDLSEHDALLVEKTLLWKLGRGLTNISSGHYADNFRPPDTLHALLTGFDYRNGIYYYNVGECQYRVWEDYVEFGFISAGQGTRWKDAMLTFHEGDVVAAYLKGHGFVGVGQLTSAAGPIRDVTIQGKSLLRHQLRCSGMASNEDSLELCEYVAAVRWIKTVDRRDAKWMAKSGLYTTTHVRASLDRQPDTLKFLEDSFQVSLREYVK